MAHDKNYLTKVWTWAKGQIVQEVPKDISHCAFNCSKVECTEAEWNACRRRMETAKRSSLRPANSQTVVSGRR